MRKIIIAIVIVLIVNACQQNTFNKTSTTNNSKYPLPVPLEDIYVKGRLLKRLETNNTRIHQGRYKPEFLHTFPSEEYHHENWPGDMAGRLIISLTQMERVLHSQSPHLAQIIKELKSHLNEKGYKGKIYTPMINEQQLSGHGWLLSGLVEYYKHTSDPKAKVLLEDMIKNLVLPTAGEHKNYPINPDDREHSGSYMGTHQRSLGNWILSSDIGCDFIFMDGAINAYLLFPSNELKEVIDEMIDRYLMVDLVEIKAQTHATLTALRGLLSYAEKENIPELIGEVEKRFEIYKTEGMTENHENYNWFGRPLWTEPCAVIDSYIAAINLWRLTGKPEYLEDAQLIYYNGMGFEERYSGAYGSSSCSGSSDPYLTLITNDNHWCCTMRGSDGLAFAAANSYLTKSDTVYIPLFIDSEVDLKLNSGNLGLVQETNYPFDDDLDITIKENHNSQAVIAFFIPEWIKNPRLKLNDKNLEVEAIGQFIYLDGKLKAGDTINLDFDMEFSVKNTFNNNSIPGYHKYYYGPLLLAYKQDAENPEEIFLSRDIKVQVKDSQNFDVLNSDVILTSVNHLMHPEVRKEYNNNEYLLQVLFK